MAFPLYLFYEVVQYACSMFLLCVFFDVVVPCVCSGVCSMGLFCVSICSMCLPYVVVRCESSMRLFDVFVLCGCSMCVVQCVC